MVDRITDPVFNRSLKYNKCFVGFVVIMQTRTLPWGITDMNIVVPDAPTIGALSPKGPAYTATMEIDLQGMGGSLNIDDFHRDFVLASTKPIPCPYTPKHEAKVAYLGSAMPGDFASGEFFGPMKEETDSFIRYTLQMGGVSLATAKHARDVLALTMALRILENYSHNLLCKKYFPRLARNPGQIVSCQHGGKPVEAHDTSIKLLSGWSVYFGAHCLSPFLVY